jgi:hypothetical protein
MSADVQPSVPETGVEAPPQVLDCDRCGRRDETLRRSRHPYVISSIRSARSVATSGVFCVRCRSIESAEAMLISIVAGWWSLKGPLLTARSIATNLSGGEIDSRLSAELHRRLAIEFEQAGDIDHAVASATVAQAMLPDNETGRLLFRLKKGGYRPRPASSWWTLLPVTTLLLLGLGVALVGLRMAASRSAAELALLRSQEVAAAAVAHNRHYVAARSIYRDYWKAMYAHCHAWNFQGFAQCMDALPVTDLEGMSTRMFPSLTDADPPSVAIAEMYWEVEVHHLAQEMESRIQSGDDLGYVRDRLTSLRNHPRMQAVVTRDLVTEKLDQTLAELAAFQPKFSTGTSQWQLETEHRRLGERITISHQMDQRLPEEWDLRRKQDEIAAEIRDREEMMRRVPELFGDLIRQADPDVSASEAKRLERIRGS